jgi:hypothetical protein
VPVVEDAREVDPAPRRHRYRDDEDAVQPADSTRETPVDSDRRQDRPGPRT